jgi:hypothetical protein
MRSASGRLKRKVWVEKPPLNWAFLGAEDGILTRDSYNEFVPMRQVAGASRSGALLLSETWLLGRQVDPRLDERVANRVPARGLHDHTP